MVCALKCQATELFFLPLPETSFNISTPPFRGCMKNVKNPSTASVVFDKTFGVSKRCSDDWKVTNKFPQKLLLEFTDSGLSINPGPLCFAKIKNYIWLICDGSERTWIGCEDAEINETPALL